MTSNFDIELSYQRKGGHFTLQKINQLSLLFRLMIRKHVIITRVQKKLPPL